MIKERMNAEIEDIGEIIRVETIAGISAKFPTGISPRDKSNYQNPYQSIDLNVKLEF